MRKAPRPTPQRLAEVLSYDTETGVLRRIGTGRVVGNPNGRGYLQLTVDGYPTLAHRVAWAVAAGQWPKGQIDHLNGDRSDNRLANLRDVDQFTNMQNMRKAPAGSKTGVLGASTHKLTSKFRSVIRVDARQKHLGYFDTPEAAHAAYVAAKREHHPGGTL